MRSGDKGPSPLCKAAASAAFQAQWEDAQALARLRAAEKACMEAQMARSETHAKFQEASRALAEALAQEVGGA